MVDICPPGGAASSSSGKCAWKILLLHYYSAKHNAIISIHVAEEGLEGEGEISWVVQINEQTPITPLLRIRNKMHMGDYYLHSNCLQSPGCNK